MLVNQERIIGRFEQQPWERKRYRVDFRQNLMEGEIILVPVFDASPVTPVPLTVSDVVVVPDGKQIIMFISGGEDGFTYRLRMRTTTNDGQNLEDEIEVRIREF